MSLQTADPTLDRRSATDSLVDRLADPELLVVDVRPLAGLQRLALPRRGPGRPPPGCAPFPIAWLASVDDAEIERQLADKGIRPERQILVYGDGPDDAGAFAGSPRARAA